MKKRIGYLDTLRFLAVSIVFFTHFIAKFRSDLFDYFHELPTSLILRGISGKLGVAILAVILGYLAFHSGQRRTQSVLSYAWKRYLFFFACGLVINLLYWAAAAFLGWGDPSSLWTVFQTSFLVDDAYFASFWCMRPFLVGSILCFLFGRHRVPLGAVACVVLALILQQQTWTAICLFGALYAQISPLPAVRKLFSSGITQVLALAACFVLINRSESVLTYLIDGACTVVLLLVLEQCRPLASVLGYPVLSSACRGYMGFFLIHALLYGMLGTYLYGVLDGFSPRAQFLICCLACFAAIWLVSIPLASFVEHLSQGLIRLVEAHVSPRLQKCKLIQAFSAPASE